MTKAALRAALRAKRDAFVTEHHTPLAFSVAPAPLREWIGAAQCVSGYVPIGSEADPEALLTHAAAMGCATALPYVDRHPAVPMRFLGWAPGDPLVEGPFGLSQPSIEDSTEVEPDLILVPLIGFDRRLHRLGQGAGHYDRAFARFPDARRVGVAWSAQEIELVPDDPWDVPLDAVLTEREWIVRDRGDC